MSSLRPGLALAPHPPGVMLERTFEGVEACLHSTGYGRFCGALFLGAWLLFWLLGEVAVVGILGYGAWSVFTGTPPGPGREPLALGPALAAAVFLLAWLALWTLGGLAALHEFFRLIWSSDRLCAKPAGLQIVRQTGFFTRRQWLPRERVRRLYRLDAALLAETLDGIVELSRLGSAQQRAEIHEALAAELKLPAVETLPAILPAEWSEIVGPGRAGRRGFTAAQRSSGTTSPARLLVKNPGTRRTQARVAWIVASAISATAVVLIDGTRSESNLLPLAVIFMVGAALSIWVAVSLQWGRTEWCIEPGRIVERRRFGSRVRTRLIADSITLTESRDSEGDAWYTVEIASSRGSEAPTRMKRRNQRKVMSGMGDPTEPRQIATWLASAAQIPLVDKTRVPADTAALVNSLEASGRFGRWLARRIGQRRERR